ncbi:MAG: D-glycero-beta-D-manno-heptose-7-phosphate kinase [Candidatus Marinimicrobia bacterium]|nr:D-glycero-beta-D-manno-heptose-7-phosphate kinase [Candidatus Neomarinimicrobiota bacterium]
MIKLLQNIKLNSNDLKKFHVLVIGDLMLDVYQSGNVNRISPEAPVPIVNITNSFERLGGAANVCQNIISLGAKCSVIGMVGNDRAGETMNRLFNENKINADQIIVSDSRPTTTKTRIIADDQQIVRIDKEEKLQITNSEEDEILLNLKKVINEIDVIILQDYNKGLLTENLIQKIVKISNKNSKLIFVDPKFDNFFAYKDVFLFKPNKKEAEKKLGVSLNSIENVENSAKMIRDKLHCKNILITLGEEGMLLLSDNDQYLTIQTRARKVHDVSGAGDTVISTLALFYTAGYSLAQSTVIANIAAGKVCEYIGVVPIKFNDLKNTIKHHISNEL